MLAVDRAQQHRAWLAVAVATWKKFSDDQAGNLAALIAYYAFASIFPLLLVAYSILDIVAQGSATVAKHLTDALRGYPVVGTTLSGQVHQGLGKTGIALAIGIVLTLYASRGVATAMQNAMNTVWEVPQFRRPGFPKALLRSFGLIAVIGPGQLITIALSSIAGGTGHLGGVAARVAAVAVSLVLNIGLFWLGFRVATAARDQRTGDAPRRDSVGDRLADPADLSAAPWSAIAPTRPTAPSGSCSACWPGSTCQAQLTLYFVELDAVRELRLWPRALAPPPLSPADVQAHQLYAAATAHRPELEVTVRERADGETAAASGGQQNLAAPAARSATASPAPQAPRERRARPRHRQ